MGAEVCRPFFTDIRVINDHIHLKSTGAQRHSTTDFTQADDTHSLVFEFITGKWSPLPLPTFQAGVCVRNIPAQREQNRHGVLCG